MRLLTIIATVFTLFCSTGIAKSKIRVACIGDSITFGSLIKDRENKCYPTQLQKLLGDKYEVRNFGNPGRGVIKSSKKGGGSRAFIKQKEHKAALQFKPDIVICNLGINDIMDYPKTGKEFTPDYVELLTAYKELKTKPKIYIWTKLGPLTKKHSFHKSKVPSEINKALKEVAQKTGATGIDMHTPFKGKDNFFPDGIHPNAEGATVIAQVTKKVISRKALKKGEKIRVACIGDSITFGTRIKKRSTDNYPTQLQKLLGKEYQVKNFGNPGRGIIKTSRKGRGSRAYIRMREHRTALRFKPHIVICNLGINDMMDYPKKKAEFIPDYLELLKAYQDLETQPQLYIWTKLGPLTPKHKKHKSTVPEDINKALDEVAKQTGATGIDMHTPLNDKPELFPDGIHPNAAGAKIIAEETHKVLTK